MNTQLQTPENYFRRVPWWAYGLLALSLVATFHFLGSVLTPFIAAFVLAYLFRPVAVLFQTLGVPRNFAVLLVFLLIIALVALVVLLLIPPLQQQTLLLIDMLPAILDWTQEVAVPWVTSRLGVDSANLGFDRLREALQENLGQAGTLVTAVLRRITTSSFAIAAFITNLLLLPVVTFYLLRDWEDMWASLAGMVPRPLLPTAYDLAREADERLAGFLRGQLLVMLVLGTWYGVGLWLAGVEFAILIGVFAGLVNFVPYLGFAVGFAAALASALFTGADPLTYLFISIVFLSGQALEGSVVTPYLVGDRIGMHPVMVIFLVLAGGKLFGFVGILMALPAGAVIAVFVRHLRDSYKRSQLYDPDRDPPPTRQVPLPVAAAHPDEAPSTGPNATAPTQGGGSGSSRS